MPSLFTHPAFEHLAPLVKAVHERLVEDRAYESYCAYRGEEEIHFFHPDSLGEMRQRYPYYRFARLVRTAPLSLKDRGRWIVFEELLGNASCIVDRELVAHYKA